MSDPIMGPPTQRLDRLEPHDALVLRQLPVPERELDDPRLRRGGSTDGDELGTLGNADRKLSVSLRKNEGAAGSAHAEVSHSQPPRGPTSANDPDRPRRRHRTLHDALTQPRR